MKYVEDILKHHKLYAATFKKLNDPMEGAFTSSPNIQNNLKQVIKDEKQKTLICSLSLKKDLPLLWAYYADGFKGVCIEFEIDNKTLDGCKIKYKKNIPRINVNDPVDIQVRKLLSRKYWKKGSGYQY